MSFCLVWPSVLFSSCGQCVQWSVMFSCWMYLVNDIVVTQCFWKVMSNQNIVLSNFFLLLLDNDDVLTIC